MFEIKTPDTYKKSYCVGRIAYYSDLTTDKQGRQYIKFTVAVDHDNKINTNQNEEKTDFFRYVAYNNKARRFEKYIHEGIMKKGKRFEVYGVDVTDVSVCIDIVPVDSNTENEIIVSLESIFKAIETDRIFSSMVVNK